MIPQHLAADEINFLEGIKPLVSNEAIMAYLLGAQSALCWAAKPSEQKPSTFVVDHSDLFMTSVRH